MSLFEYTVDEHLKWGAKENREDGIAIGKAEGIAQGKTEGKAEGKAESILEILNDLGTVSPELTQKVMAEKRIEVLSHWLRLAAKSESITGFEHQI